METESNDTLKIEVGPDYHYWLMYKFYKSFGRRSVIVGILLLLAALFDKTIFLVPFFIGFLIAMIVFQMMFLKIIYHSYLFDEEGNPIEYEIKILQEKWGSKKKIREFGNQFPYE